MLVLDSSIEAVADALKGGTWLIGCSCNADDPCDHTGIVLENVWRFETDGIISERFGSPVIVSYGISPAAADRGEYLYRIHDDTVSPIREGDLEAYAQALVLTYDAFLVDDEGDVDRILVYGKIGTVYQDDVIFINSI